jgi:hypothetical protein
MPKNELLHWKLSDKDNQFPFSQQIDPINPFALIKNYFKIRLAFS